MADSPSVGGGTTTLASPSLEAARAPGATLAVGEARGLLGERPQRLHRLYPGRQAFAVLAFVHVEPCELADAVEAVADGVTVGKEVACRPDGAGVVPEVGREGLDEVRAVAGVVADYRLQGLAVEGLELLGVLLEDPEEELVGACSIEGRYGGGAMDAVPDLQGHLRLGVRIREQGRVPLVAPDPDGDREIRQQALDVALNVSGQPASQLGELLGGLLLGGAKKEYDVVGAGTEQKVREELAGLEAHRVGQASLELLDNGLLRLAALQVAGEVVYVYHEHEGALGEVGAEVAGSLQEEIHGSVVPAHHVVHEVAPHAELGLEAYALLAELGLEHAPRPVQQHHVLRSQRPLLEVHPQVARWGTGPDGGPEKLALSHTPPLDGDGEVAVGEPGVAVPPLAARLFHPRALRGPEAVAFEERAQGTGRLAAGALEERPADAVGEEQEPVSPREDGAQPPERHLGRDREQPEV